MAIIFPSHCKGVTAGALRELKQHGFSTAGGGLFSQKLIEQIPVNTPNMYFSKNEPAGVYMSNLEQTQRAIDENTEAIEVSAKRLVEAAVDANKQMAHVNGKFREGTEKLGVAVDKLMKIVNRGDFAETVRLTESFVDSLERLAVLEEKGILDKVMKAMKH